MLEDVKAFARAIAAANGHPDPDAYADQVAQHYAAQNQPAAPAAATAPADTAAAPTA